MTMPLKVNFTGSEATSTVREIPPSGEYLCFITDGELKEVSPERKNVGKPYWRLTFVIQEGAYSGTTLVSSIMLFDGSLFQLSQLMKSLGYNIEEGSFVLPALDEIIGKPVNVRGYKRPAETKGGRELNERFEIKGFKAPSKMGAVKSSTNALLP